MPIYKLKLLATQEVARDTIKLTLEKPDGFTFKPGQYGGFTLINPKETDKGGITRRFSLLSSPDDPFIAITTRRQNSAYKRELLSLSIGDEIKFAGPTGTFTLHEDMNVPAVLIAGGIGIVPFFCMLQFATRHQQPYPIHLFYGNQNSTDAAFLSELEELAKRNSNFKLVATMDKPDETWKGEQGYITREMIKKYIKNIHEPFYYICGSPTMVTVLQEMLAEMGIDEDRIKVEDFPGY